MMNDQPKTSYVIVWFISVNMTCQLITAGLTLPVHEIKLGCSMTWKWCIVELCSYGDLTPCVQRATIPCVQRATISFNGWHNLIVQHCIFTRKYLALSCYKWCRLHNQLPWSQLPMLYTASMHSSLTVCTRPPRRHDELNCWNIMLSISDWTLSQRVPV